MTEANSAERRRTMADLDRRTREPNPCTCTSTFGCGSHTDDLGERTCPARRTARGDEPCTGAPRFEVVYRSGRGKVLDRLRVCFEHGLAEVERAQKAGTAARVDLEEPVPS